MYEYGIFRQKLVDGWQTELPDFWLPGGECWLLPRPELAKEVKFDGQIREWWGENGLHHVEHENAAVVLSLIHICFFDSCWRRPLLLS